MVVMKKITQVMESITTFTNAVIHSRTRSKALSMSLHPFAGS
jgi:hypothetical protein